ncbi:MAG: SCP2 sterol-binding domain-containing protein [SAR324 cluster bacterium]|nr:SCP2 sterol-binding domain-containing protein [SAR324 cluster bacterium]
MSSEWADAVCKAWNENKTLVNELAGDWMKNNGKRGYKVIHLYRSDCADSPRVELTITEKPGEASCGYGGSIKHQDLNSDMDYVMYATDEDWQCMGDGVWGCGPMGAMATGKLNFEGPQFEAMSVMGPFEEFLLLTGKVNADRDSCPK